LTTLPGRLATTDQSGMSLREDGCFVDVAAEPRPREREGDRRRPNALRGVVKSDYLAQYASAPPRLPLFAAEHSSALRVHQMGLCARKARHLDTGEFIVFGSISGQTLNVVARVGAAVEERRHDLAFLSFLPVVQ
jgi:hypothetical protein